MNRKPQVLMIAALALFAASPVFAGHGHRNDDDHSRHGYRQHDDRRVAGVQKRLHIQHRRIDHGVENGSLTRREEHKLWRQQKHIRHLAKDFRQDGYLSRKEHEILTRKLDKASDRIRRLKHNDADRYCRTRDHGKHPAWSEAERLALVRKLESDSDR
jgi:hypothetical protein